MNRSFCVFQQKLTERSRELNYENLKVIPKILFFYVLIWQRVRVKVMVFNITFNNISLLSWQSVSLVEETGESRENHRQTYHIMLNRVHLTMSHIQTLSSNLANSKVYSTQHYVIKFVSDLRQVGGFLWFHPPINLTATIWLKFCWKWR